MPYVIAVDKKLKAKMLAIEPHGQTLENWCWAACSEMVVSYMRSGLSDAFPNLAQAVDNKDIAQGASANRANSGRATAAASWPSCPQEYRDRVVKDAAVDCSLTLDSARKYKACNKLGQPDLREFDRVVQSTQWSSHRYVVEELGISAREHGWPRTVDRRLSSRELRALVKGSGPQFDRRIADSEDCALSWPVLKSLIDAELPVIFSWRFAKSGGHLLLAAGYVVTPKEKWVMVIDPLPPGHGDWYLVPYDYYVAGPWGRHWRDYWIPRPGAAGTLPPRLSIDNLVMGRDLERSRVEVEDDEFPLADAADPERLTAKEEKAAKEVATDGLEALKAIALESPKLAATLGMGGSTIRTLLRAFLTGFLESERHQELADRVGMELKGAEFDVDLLEFAEDYIPVFGLSTKELKKWDQKNTQDLLRRASTHQVVFAVERGDLDIYRFFSTVTVQRYGEGWRLASIGKASLSTAFSLDQLFAGLSVGSGPSLAAFIQHLDELGLLEPIAKIVSKSQVRSLIEGLTATSEEREPSPEKLPEWRGLAETLEKTLGPEPDLAGLKALAKKADKILGFTKRPPEVDKPRFAVEVGSLYQLFVAYPNDRMESVYPSAFHPPGRRVKAGTWDKVFKGLQRLAHDQDRD